MATWPIKGRGRGSSEFQFSHLEISEPEEIEEYSLSPSPGPQPDELTHYDIMLKEFTDTKDVMDDDMLRARRESGEEAHARQATGEILRQSTRSRSRHGTGEPVPDDEILKQIAALDDMDEAFNLTDELEVNPEGCQNLEDAKDRLRYHRMKELGLMKDLQEVEKIMTDVHDEDVRRKDALGEIFCQESDLLDQMNTDDALHRQVEQESITNNFMATSRVYVNALNAKHCPVVFAGETSSGKSSLLNLLLGEVDVLPVQLLPCTSTICEVSYGETRVCRTITAGGRTKHFDYADRIKYIYKEERREERFQHERVQIDMPLPILKSGVTFVDTPGIGESSSMGSVLMDYVASHNIYGFIYVIKSDNAGGVAKDRLMYLLQQLLQLNKDTDRQKFDPRTALFVCNRWDKVPVPERDEVREHIVHRLNECWPRFDPNKQLVMMDSNMAHISWKNGYITDDYAGFLDRLRIVLPQTLESRTSNIFEYVERVILRVLHGVKTCLRFASSSNLDTSSVVKMQKMVSDIGDRIQQFEKDLDDFIRRCKTYLVSDLHRYIKSSDTWDHMTTWTPQDIPKVSMNLKWCTVMERLREVIDIRMASVITNWEGEKHLTKKVQDKIFHFVKRRFSVIKENMQQVEKIIRNDVLDNHTFSGIVEQVTKDVTLEPLNDEEGMKEMLDFETNVMRTVVEGEKRYNRTLEQMQERFTSGPMYRSLSEDHYESMQEDMFKKDEIEFLEKLSHKVLQYYSKTDSLWKLVDFQMRDLEDYLFFNVVRQSSERLSANAAILTLVKDDFDSGQVKKNISDKKVYMDLEVKALKTWRATQNYYNAYVRQYEYTDSDVEYLKHQMAGEYVIEGAFPKSALAKVKDSRTKVTLRRQNNVKGSFSLTEEESHLRRIQGKNSEIPGKNSGKNRHFPELLGTLQEVDGPALVLDGHLVAAREYLDQYSDPQLPRYDAAKRRELFLKRYKDLLNAVIHGVVYLHLEPLVHVVLTLDSILVDTLSGVPKLTCLCEPMVLDLNQYGQDVKHFLFLAPEVLAGETYTSAADVYSLGLIMAELWNQKQPFGMFRLVPREDFVEVLKTPKYKERSLHEDTMPEGLKDLIHNATRHDPKTRPSSIKIQQKWIMFLNSPTTPKHGRQSVK